MLSSVGQATASQLPRNSSALLFLVKSFQNFRAGCESGRRFGGEACWDAAVWSSPGSPQDPRGSVPTEQQQQQQSSRFVYRSQLLLLFNISAGEGEPARQPLNYAGREANTWQAASTSSCPQASQMPPERRRGERGEEGKKKKKGIFKLMSRRVMETWLEVILHFAVGRAGGAARDVPLALAFPRAGKMFGEVLERCNYSRAAAGTERSRPSPTPGPAPRTPERRQPPAEGSPWDGDASHPTKGTP